MESDRTILHLPLPVYFFYGPFRGVYSKWFYLLLYPL